MILNFYKECFCWRSKHFIFCETVERIFPELVGKDKATVEFSITAKEGFSKIDIVDCFITRKDNKNVEQNVVGITVLQAFHVLFNGSKLGTVTFWVRISDVL